MDMDRVSRNITNTNNHEDTVTLSPNILVSIYRNSLRYCGHHRTDGQSTAAAETKDIIQWVMHHIHCIYNVIPNNNITSARTFKDAGTDHWRSLCAVKRCNETRWPVNPSTAGYITFIWQELLFAVAHIFTHDALCLRSCRCLLLIQILGCKPAVDDAARLRHQWIDKYRNWTDSFHTWWIFFRRIRLN